MSDYSLLAEADRKLYLGILEEIYRRIEQARIFIQGGATQPAIESAALQLRIVIELIVMASLVTNNEKIEEITTALANKSVDEARKLVRNANPDYWPKANRAHDEPGKIRQLLPVDGALTEDRWLREWGMLSELLHARNPFACPFDVERAHANLVRLAGEIITLLTHHVLKLADGRGLLVGQIDPAGRVSVAELAPLGSTVQRAGNRKERRAVARSACIRPPNGQGTGNLGFQRRPNSPRKCSVGDNVGTTTCSWMISWSRWLGKPEGEQPRRSARRRSDSPRGQELGSSRPGSGAIVTVMPLW